MTPLLLYSFFPAHVPRALTYSSCFLPYFRSHEAKPRSFNKDQRWRPVPSFIIRNTISTRQREMPCVCVCVSYKCGKTGEVLEETWAAKKSEGQDMRAEGGIKRRVGCRMVARVTVRVATPYVNPPIWSILQSKRIGFLWRWISSAGKLFLPLSLSHLLYLLYLSLWLFFLFLLWFHVWFLSWLASSPLPAFSASPWWCLFGHIRIDMIPCDIFQMPICLSHLRDYSMCCVFFLYVCALFLSPGLSQRWQGGCNRESLAWLPFFFFKCHTILLPSAAHGSWWNVITHWCCLMCSTMEGTN